MMSTEHYKCMGRLSAQARKLAREAKSELDRVGEPGLVGFAGEYPTYGHRVPNSAVLGA
jgi:hypothetical protein